MKYVFNFTFRTIIVVKKFKFLFWLFGHVEKKIKIEKKKVNFKIYDVTTYATALTYGI